MNSEILRENDFVTYLCGLTYCYQELKELRILLTIKTSRTNNNFYKH